MKSKSKLWLKAISALTAGTLMMSMTACSGLTEKVEEFVEEAAVPGSITAYAEGTGAPVIDKKARGWVSRFGNLRLDMPQTHLDPEQVYKNIDYTADYFFGEYCEESLYKNGEFQYKGDSVKTFFTSHKSIDYPYLSERKINLLPVKINCSSSKMSLWFCSDSDENNLTSVDGELDVKDGKLVFTPADKYKFTEPLVYDFSFRGPHLTLSCDGESVELTSPSFSEDYSYNKFTVDNQADGQMPDDIVLIHIYKYGNNNTYKTQECYLKTKENNDYIKNVAAYLGDDGRFNFSWTDDNGTIHAYEMVYFYVDRGIILTDGSNTYFYTKR